jgi:hypothetical protein
MYKYRKQKQPINDFSIFMELIYNKETIVLKQMLSLHLKL